MVEIESSARPPNTSATMVSASRKVSSCIVHNEKHFKNEQRSKDAAAKKRPNTSGVGKINNYYEDIYIPAYNNTD